MGSCCSNAVKFGRDVVNDIKWKYADCCPSCGITGRDENCSKSRNLVENSCFTQTEEVVFKLIEEPDLRLNLLKRNVRDDPGDKRNRNWSTEVGNSSMSLVSKRRRSTAGRARSVEEVLDLIERIQDICSRTNLNDQLSLLCTTGFLREYCLLLNEDIAKNRKKSNGRVLNLIDEDEVRSEGADFWVSAYNHRHTERGIKRFKKMAMAVRTAIAIASLGRTSLTSSSSSATNIFLPATSTDECSEFLEKNLLKWEFDQFLFDKLTSNHGISYLFLKILKRSNLLNEFKISGQKVMKFCLEVEKGYQMHNNPYHNERHGADVLQTTYFLIVDTKIQDWLSSLELLSILFAAMIHDLEHTGTNNIFHKQSRSELSLLYNDKSVLENHHVSRAYQILADDELNPFKAMTKTQFMSMREIVVDCVMATDMAHHFTQVNTLKNSLIDLSLIERQDVMNSILHCADISGPGKTWSIHENWTLLLMQEFFAQGDKERELGLPISPLCDRQTTNIPESQVGFITYITTPAFAALGNTIDAILREKEEQEFLELSTPWVKNRRGSAVGAANQQMPPVEEVGGFHRRNSTLRADRSGLGSAGGNPTFFYKPINRVWDEHFQRNLSRWKGRLENNSN